MALDNPFTDPVSDGQLTGAAPPLQGAPQGLPFAVHHHNLTQAGIHNIQNAKLDELAEDKVWTSCAMILPLRSRGASGSPVRPVGDRGPARLKRASWNAHSKGKSNSCAAARATSSRAKASWPSPRAFCNPASAISPAIRGRPSAT